MQIVGYVELNELKDWLDITYSSKDIVLGTLIEATSERIDNYCRRDFAPHANVTETYWSEWRDTFLLRYYPVTEIISISIDDYEGNSDLSLGILKIPSPYYGEFSVTYNAGSPTPPKLVAQVCRELCALYWANRKHEGVAGENISGYSYSVDPQAEARILSKLDSYRDIVPRG
ncbi:MAG: head-tail connector protein [Candidatus Brocadiales bacterium]